MRVWQRVIDIRVIDIEEQKRRIEETKENRNSVLGENSD